MPDSLASPETVFSACPHDCPSTCALEVERLDDRTIGRVRGSHENRYTDGAICAKVARYAERIHHPDRLTACLQRTGPKGSGEFRELSFADAIAETAEAFLKAEARYGSETVWPYFYAGTMGQVQRDSIHRLRHAKKYSFQHETICVPTAWNGFVAGTGSLHGADPREMRVADVVVIWGTNAVATQVNVMTHAAHARKTRGAKIVVVDTYRTETARQADQFLCVRPGTDGALACAVMHVLFRDGHADRPYLERYTDCPGELEAHLQTRTPAWAEAICGVPAAEIEAFAALLAANRKHFLRIGYGMTRQRNGAHNMHAVLSIAAVSGAWQFEGGGAFHNNRDIYRWNKTLVEGRDYADPSIRRLDMSRIGEVLTGDPEALRGGPPVTGLFIQNTNPMMVAPDLTKVHRGFAREDLFTCVHEQFLTDTAKMADIVIPATMFLEHDDVYQGGGHQYILLGPKVIEPPGDCRSNVAVINALAQRLGCPQPAFRMSARDLVDATLKASKRGSYDELLVRKWVDCQVPFEEAHYLNGFAWPDGKFRFKPDWTGIPPTDDATGTGRFGPADRMPALPDHWDAIDRATAEKPFRMVTAPARSFLNSTFTETPTSRKREGRPEVMIRAEDAAPLGIADGAPVRIGNEKGAVTVHARYFDGLTPNTVVVESVWPNHAFPEGVGINRLTSSQPSAPIGGAPFHDTAVWIRPAE
ncbi:MAG: molybdopterin oxidoreductase family protein [Alphaproteobacteria bacterium]|nr:molybdopterin oxidoreductase family protein [Alphaproteobacteria bacterium]MCB9928532.1 molybdopterin oxidoreductase family protein [Alphaproteobacteria bacterium]